MALATVNDWKAALNAVLYYIDVNFSGIDKYGFPIQAKILPEDFAVILSGFYAYKQTREAAKGVGVAHIVGNATPSANKTTFQSGGGTVESTSPDTF